MGNERWRELSAIIEKLGIHVGYFPRPRYLELSDVENCDNQGS